MKVCLVRVSERQTPVVALYHEASSQWIPLCRLLSSQQKQQQKQQQHHDNNDEQLANCTGDVLRFLAFYMDSEHKRQLVRGLMDRYVSSSLSSSKLNKDDTNNNNKKNFEMEQFAFRPVSWRDCSLWERHMVDSARNLVRNHLLTRGTMTSRMASTVLSLLEAPFKCLGKSLPIYRPNQLWYEQPLHYMANHLNLYGTGDTVPVPSYASFFDYELEIGVIIGREGRNWTESEAERSIGGFVVWNDFSVRNVQLGEAFGKFGFSKSKNCCNQMGNIVVTADEFLPKLKQCHGSVIEARCTINSAVVGRGNTAGMVHSVGEAIAFISQSETLHPGEVIGLGTIPGCCGIEHNRPLKSGDHLELSIDGLGSIQCTIGERERVPSDHWRSEQAKRRAKSEHKALSTTLLQIVLSLLACLLSLLAYQFIVHPSPIEPEAFTPDPTPLHIPFDFDFPVHFVQHVQKFSNDSFAPESFVSDKKRNIMYTSMRDGTVRTVDFESGANEIIARTGSLAHAQLPSIAECSRPSMYHICGVPLGLHLRDNRLYVADAYYGVLVIDLDKNNEMRVVVDNYGGVPFKFVNNVVVASDGMLYFTDTSTRFHLVDYPLETIEGNGRGRLFRYDMGTGKLDVLLDGLHFANGLILSHNETKLLISETTRFRIREYDLRQSPAENAANVRYFTQNIPCFPDNIRQYGNEITVGCASPRTRFTQTISRYPGLRSLLTKVPYFSTVFRAIRPKAGLILIIDAESGKLKKAIYDPKKRFHSISEAHVDDGYIYVGSFDNPFIARFAYEQ